MTLKLYDLAGADERLRFSPYCWRAKMALMHKGLAFETIPWRFTEKELLAPTGQGRVPVLVDGARWVHDSFKIAEYLDATYPDRPAIFPNADAKAYAQFVAAWCEPVFMVLRPLAVPAVYAVVAEQDRSYFKQSREKALGPLDALGKDWPAGMTAVAQALKPAETRLAEQDFLNGVTPGYADYTLYGTLRWPDTVCRTPVIAPETAVARWYARMSTLFGGKPGQGPTVRTL